MRAMVRMKIEALVCADIIEANSAQEAIAKLKQQNIDIVISDQWMEHDLGTDVLSHIREHTLTTCLFILFSSDKKFIAQFKQNKNCVAIPKPNLRQLVETVVGTCCINFFT